MKGLRLVTAAVLLVLAGGGCQSIGTQGSEQPSRYTIVVHGFSIMQEVMTEAVFPAFQGEWRAETDSEVVFQSVFTGSEQLTDEIMSGGRADVALLSNEQHAVWLHISDWVESDWRAFPHQGIVSRSPIVIVVRPGNPLGIRDWADLARPGVRVVHPDPRSSGGAQWALLAEYGSALLAHPGGRSQEAAREQLLGIWANVVSSPPSAREALNRFVFGVGDALVTYEQDALLARSRDAALDVVVPRSTVLSEHVAVLVDRNVQPWEREAVEAFVAFLWSESAQRALTRYYFRAVTDEGLNAAVEEFAEFESLFTVDDLGGWGQAYPEIIHGVWEESAPRPAE
jgi:sulfate/thiosulfate-binding protein